jgi:hypothetical protein
LTSWSESIAKMESDIVDDDQDGVPNYLDQTTPLKSELL